MARSATTGAPNPAWPTCSTSSPAATDRSPQEVAAGYTRYGDLKKDVAEALDELLRPVRQRRAALEADLAYVDAVLAEGAANAHGIAALTYARASDAIGLLSSSPPD